jgi:hypothetical protein
VSLRSESQPPLELVLIHDDGEVMSCEEWLDMTRSASKRNAVGSILEHFSGGAVKPHQTGGRARTSVPLLVASIAMLNRIDRPVERGDAVNLVGLL